MAAILSLETSTDICSVALHEQGTLLATSEVHIEQSHASKLAVLIDQVLKNAGVSSRNLKAVAVSAGPGSYTGLRIGASTAKGLCLGLNIPLIGIGTLELLAFQMKNFNLKDGYLCPMIDARRMEVYCFLTDADLNVILPVDAKVVDESSFASELEQKEILFFGNGAPKCKNVICHPNARFVDGVYPQASQLGFLAFRRWQHNAVDDVSLFKPAYFKDFVAKKAKSLI